MTLKDKGVLDDRLGPLYARVTQGGPQVPPSSINKLSNPADYTTMRINIGPFQVLTAPALPPQQAATSAVAPTLSEFAIFLTTKEDRKENTRVAKGFVRLSSTFIAENVDFKRGTIQSLVLTTPTNAHTAANKEETLDERTNYLPRHKQRRGYGPGVCDGHAPRHGGSR